MLARGPARACCRHLAGATFSQLSTMVAASEPQQQLQQEDKKLYSVEEAMDYFLHQRKIKHKNAYYFVEVNLNLLPKGRDDRLQGCFELPHGTGRKMKVLALTSHKFLADLALFEKGAKYAGTIDVEEMKLNLWSNDDKRIVKNVKPSLLGQRVVATDEYEDICSEGKFAQLLYRYQKMAPSWDTRTIVEEKDFLEAVEKHASGEICAFRMSKFGGVSSPVGKVGAHDSKQVSQNIDAVLKHLVSMRPEDFETQKYAYVLGVKFGVMQVSKVSLDLMTLNESAHIAYLCDV